MVQISAFTAEHNLPFTLANPLLSLIQSSVPTDSSEKTALSQIHLNATKCTNIIRQGTGLYFISMLTKKLQKTKFSLILDETTNVATEKQLGIVVVWCDAENLNLITQFLDLVPVCDNTANGLYGALKASLQAKNFPRNITLLAFHQIRQMPCLGPMKLWLLC